MVLATWCSWPDDCRSTGNFEKPEHSRLGLRRIADLPPHKCQFMQCHPDKDSTQGFLLDQLSTGPTLRGSFSKRQSPPRDRLPLESRQCCAHRDCGYFGRQSCPPASPESLGNWDFPVRVCQTPPFRFRTRNVESFLHSCPLSSKQAGMYPESQIPG
jgi:hypothetical protein